jgi:hypothetical protein
VFSTVRKATIKPTVAFPAAGKCQRFPVRQECGEPTKSGQLLIEGGEMSQRDSVYVRIERDMYETPAWVTEALLPHLPAWCRMIWEPAAGSGKMSRVLKSFADTVVSSDISQGQDFLEADGFDGDGIITNPPYERAVEFIKHALSLTAPDRLVAMLLRTDFDHARSRRHLFQHHPAFSRKLVLTKRIRWFEDSKGGPSFNHAWFVWNYQHKGPPTLAYGP